MNILGFYCLCENKLNTDETSLSIQFIEVAYIMIIKDTYPDFVYEQSRAHHFI